MDYDLVRRYSRHALLGLSHLHQAGIAHLDICMSNMLVTLRDSTLKLSDLGMSADARMVSLPWKVGKSYWRSPEAVLASGWHSTRVVTPSIVSVDLWGVGAVMASLYVGSILFDIYEKTTRIRTPRFSPYRHDSWELQQSLLFAQFTSNMA